jgi:hypothetical protein
MREAALASNARRARVQSKHWAQETALCEILRRWLCTYRAQQHVPYVPCASELKEQQFKPSIVEESRELKRNRDSELRGHSGLTNEPGMKSVSELSRDGHCSPTARWRICVLEIGAGAGELSHMLQCVEPTNLVPLP